LVTVHALDAAALVSYLAVVGFAFRRNRLFGVFAIVVLGFPTYVGVALREHVGVFTWLVPALQAAAFVHFGALLLRQSMRPLWFRALVSIPGMWFVACSLLALPWAIAASIGVTPHGWWIPFVIGLGGLWQSLYTREETVDFHLRTEDSITELRRFPEALAPAPTSPRPLTIVQITDPHLGPFMSVERLRRICERAVERDPDLVLVTGDLMTMESHDVDIVSRAIEPLKALRGRVFACHGNHDHEARQVVATAYARTGVELLVDEAAIVDTPAGRVQIVGADFVWRRRDVHLQSLCERCPREPGALRVVMLHDPGAFKHLPDGEGDLVLSGHTHGGQVGLLSLGLRATFVSVVTAIPDHGPWAKGRNRLYVHRAQGLYGFPIRLGVPAEESLMRVHFSV
jgi:predicted MPP superfamily phosphohydrolase